MTLHWSNRAYPSHLVHRLARAFEFVGGDGSLVDNCRTQAEAVRNKAADVQEPVMTLDASLGAALSGQRRA